MGETKKTCERNYGWLGKIKNTIIVYPHQHVDLGEFRGGSIMHLTGRGSPGASPAGARDKQCRIVDDEKQNVRKLISEKSALCPSHSEPAVIKKNPAQAVSV